MERGKIYRVNKSDLNIDGYDHYFVFLENYYGELFHGIMLTHHRRERNIPMQASHFKTRDSEGNVYEFTYDNTKFANAKLLKDSSLPIEGPKGELTEEGISFIEGNLSNTDVKTWAEARAEALNLVNN